MYKTDLSTLLLILAINKALLGLLMLLMRRLTPTVKGLKQWGWGSIFTGFGLFIFSISPWPNGLINSVLLNLFTLGGDVIFLSGFWKYKNKKFNKIILFGFPTSTIVIAIVFTCIFPLTWLRAGIIGLIYFAFYLLVAFELLDFKHERLYYLFKWCAGLYFFYSFLQLARGILYLYYKPVIILAENPFSIILFAAAGISVILTTYILIIIINARLNEELKDQVNSKNKLYTIVAHDLRGPIGNIMNYVALSKRAFESSDNEMLKNYLNDMERASHLSRMLLENLFNWSRNQLYEIQLNAKVNDIEKSIAETIKMLSSQANAKKIVLESKLNAPLYAFFDKEMIDIVLRNLITNAIKFTPEGGNVTISAVEKINLVELHVTDNGVGIPQNNIDLIFDKKLFFTTRGTTNEKGTGFGLLLCKEFVERNGGTIKVESKIGQGSNFVFSLPKSENI